MWPSRCKAVRVASASRGTISAVLVTGGKLTAHYAAPPRHRGPAQGEFVSRCCGRGAWPTAFGTPVDRSMETHAGQHSADPPMSGTPADHPLARSTGHAGTRWHAVPGKSLQELRW